MLKLLGIYFLLIAQSVQASPCGDYLIHSLGLKTFRYWHDYLFRHQEFNEIANYLIVPSTVDLFLKNPERWESTVRTGLLVANMPSYFLETNEVRQLKSIRILDEAVRSDVLPPGVYYFRDDLKIQDIPRIAETYVESSFLKLRDDEAAAIQSATSFLNFKFRFRRGRS